MHPGTGFHQRQICLFRQFDTSKTTYKIEITSNSRQTAAGAPLGIDLTNSDI